jgi:hypothetical protein
LSELNFNPSKYSPFLTPSESMSYYKICTIKKFEPDQYIFTDLWKVPDQWYDEHSPSSLKVVTTNIYFGDPNKKEMFTADQTITKMMQEERVADQMEVILNILPTFNMDLNQA